MEEIKLDVQIRPETGTRKLRSVRRDGYVPAIVYGGKQDPTAIKVDRRAFERIRRQHAGERLLFHLNVMEGDKKLRDYSVIINEEQHDPVSDGIHHIDFKRISLTEKIRIEIPVTAKGEPVGVKRDRGSLEHLLWNLEIVCLPTNIPQHITVDVSALEIGDAVHVRDIVLPEGVTTDHEPEAMVFTVVPPGREEEEAPAEAAEGEPEVIKKKEGKEGEEAAEEKKAEPASKEESKKEEK